MAPALLDRLTRHVLDPRLVTPAAGASIRRASAGLPARALHDMAGVEVRLGGDDERCDLAVCAYRGGAAWLADWAGSRTDAVAELARAWSSGEPALAGIDRVWFELDCDPSDTGTSGFAFGGVFCSCRFDGADFRDAGSARAALSLLLGSDEAEARWARIGDLYDRLGPTAGTVFQLGVMLGRDAVPVRMCVLPRDLGEAAALLDVLPEPRLSVAARSALTRYGPAARLACVDLDLCADGWQPIVGLELYSQLPGEPASGARWVETLDRLHADGYLVDDKAAALAEYPRSDAGWSRAALLDGHRRTRFVANLHHVKLALRTGAAPSAKGYLAFWCEWV